jgi:cellulose synthase/poly-beta-1,6-N-acetylglucosamine synthase-like glycosyltransferase
MLALAILLALTSLPALVCATYLFALTVLSVRGKPPAPVRPRMKFDFVVPSHNEEGGIAQTVKSLLAVDWPAELRRVVVVADNCVDATAANAEAAGAKVLVRNDKTLRGKGYALKHAFEILLAEGFADALVVIDADTIVSPNLLAAFAARFEAGAKAVQAEYGVANARSSWRTRLMVIALATFHGVRSYGRERLHVSCGLRGNGMGFSAQVLREIPHDAFSIVEDVEYGIRLGRAGYAVRYVGEAHVLGEMVSGEKASRSQRQRWEGGRMKLMRQFGWPLLKESFANRSKVQFDLAMDVLVPPLTYVVGSAAIGALFTGVMAFVWRGPFVFAAMPFALSLAMLVLYVLRGVMLSGAGFRGLLDLMWAPVYILWKLVLSISHAKRSTDEWIRTAREGEKP